MNTCVCFMRKCFDILAKTTSQHSRCALIMANNKPSNELKANIEQLSELVKGDPAILQAGLSAVPLPEAKVQSTVDVESGSAKARNSKRSAEITEKKNFKEPRKRPNYFIAFPIRSQEIHEKIKKVQDDVVKSNKLFEKALISLPKLHITFTVMYFDDTDEETVNKAMELLNKCYEKLLTDELINLDLTFEGLGHFSSGVLFAKLSEDGPLEKLEKIAAIIRETFTDERFIIDAKAFKVHLTILKLSKVDFRTKKMCGKVTTTLYDENKDLILGTEKMNCLQLLSMDKPKDDDGCYYCLKSLSFPENV